MKIVIRRSAAAAACLSLARVVLLASVPRADAQLAFTEVEDVKVVYVRTSGDYLVPHAVRTFLNSLRFHKKLFDFTPSEEITALLLDFEDSGNASATAVPRNSVNVQVAPLSFAFETIAGNDRMNIIMNHELLHVVAMDQATRRDRMWRRLFRGKVMPLAEQPESILYFFATTPRVAAPRWYHEGAATFLDTWMAGGLGRAQSGYDEMVFRAMVKDGAEIYDPLGLTSEGTKIDFQLQINSYLYGTRFMVWLARTYSPEQVVSWIGRREGSAGYYAASVPQGLRDHHRAGVDANGSRTNVSSRPPTSRRCASSRSRRTPTSRRARLGSVSRAVLRRRDRHDLRGTQLPRRGRPPRRHRRADRRRVPADRHQGADRLHRDVARARPGTRHAVLHRGQRLVARPRGRSTRPRGSGRCCRRTRASGTSPSTVPTVRCGACAS